MYVVGFFHKDPNSTATQTEETRCIQAGHIANFEKLADAGKLIVAGPFSDDGELRGMLIFKLNSVDEARDLMNADPALKSGRLSLDLHPWFAAAGLRANPPNHRNRRSDLQSVRLKRNCKNTTTAKSTTRS